MQGSAPSPGLAVPIPGGVSWSFLVPGVPIPCPSGTRRAGSGWPCAGRERGCSQLSPQPCIRPRRSIPSSPLGRLQPGSAPSRWGPGNASTTTAPSALAQHQHRVPWGILLPRDAAGIGTLLASPPVWEERSASCNAGGALRRAFGPREAPAQPQSHVPGALPLPPPASSPMAVAPPAPRAPRALAPKGAASPRRAPPPAPAIFVLLRTPGYI